MFWAGGFKVRLAVVLDDWCPCIYVYYGGIVSGSVH